LASKAMALLALARALNDFLDSGLRSGGDEEQEPLDRDEALPEGPLHNAVVGVEAFYQGGLPQPLPRLAWLDLTRARDDADNIEWERVATRCSEVLAAWVHTELSHVFQAADPVELGREFGDSELVDTGYELKYRALARELISGFEAPRDVERMAAFLCRVMHLQPSEFHKLTPKGRYEFALMAKEVLAGAPPARDRSQKDSQGMPDNPDVRDLCHLLDKNRDSLASGAKTEIGVAREFTRETPADDTKAQNLLRQARRYPRLWKRTDT
jgi:hypothetical protein